jgi:hypothetical protein
MIFAIATNTLFTKKQTDEIVSKSFLGYMQASRDALNKSEKKYFNSIKSIAKETSKKQAPKETKEKNKIRKINPILGKVNILPLLNDRDNQKDLYNLCASLIKTLYSNQSFYKKNLEYNLLNSLISSYNKLKKTENIHLESLVLKDPDLQKTFYKILKGTKFYDFKNSIGTPSLLDFIKLENTNAKPSFANVTMEMLRAIFNDTIAEEIRVLQKEDPPSNLTWENVKLICKKNIFTPNEDILELFDFSNSFNRSSDKTIVGFDESTNIKIKRKMN